MIRGDLRSGKPTRYTAKSIDRTCFTVLCLPPPTHLLHPQPPIQLTLTDSLFWGEASQVQFIPRCLCFIFKCMDNYYWSPECQNHVEPVPKGLYLRVVTKLLYRFIHGQGYEVVDRKFVETIRIIGYDDVNQLFWYSRIILNDKVCQFSFILCEGADSYADETCRSSTGSQFMRFDRVDWNWAFFKTYSEKCSSAHLLVNFNQTWVIHIAMYSFTPPLIYLISIELRAAPHRSQSLSHPLKLCTSSIIEIPSCCGLLEYNCQKWVNRSENRALYQSDQFWSFQQHESTLAIALQV